MLETCIFLGPTLDVERAKAVVPSARFCAPAEQGDLLAAVDRDGAQVIGLIDGVFHQSLSVWHSEICYLLSSGITIYGASSMGALRAVETAPFGMVGVGRVFGWYFDGTLTDDDEVALLHGDASSGFLPLSFPMVNIRASVERALQSGGMEQACAARALAVAKKLHYPDRTLPSILESCRTDGLEGEQVSAVARALTDDYVDVKQRDALALLREVKEVIEGSKPRPVPVRFTFNRSSVFEALYTLDRKVHVGTESTTLQAVAEHAALYNADFGRTRRAAAERAIAVFLARLLDLKPTSVEIAQEREIFDSARGFTTDTQRDEWLSRNKLSTADFGEILWQEALCRRLRHWVFAASSLDRGCRAVLDELRLQGSFESALRETIEREEVVAAFGNEPEYESVWTEHPALLAARHAAFGKVAVTGDASKWAEEAGFADVEALKAALQTANVYDSVKARARKSLDALLSLPPAEADAYPHATDDR